MVKLLSLPMIVTSALSFMLAAFFTVLATRLRHRSSREHALGFYRIFSWLAAANGVFLASFSVLINSSENLARLDISNRLTIIAAMFTIALTIHFFTAFFSVKPPLPMAVVYAVCAAFTVLCSFSNELFLARRFYRTCSYYVGLEFGPLFQAWGAFVGLVSAYGLVVLVLVYRRTRRHTDGRNRPVIMSLIAASFLWLLTALCDNLTGIQLLDLPPLSWLGACATTLAIALVLLRHIDSLYEDKRQLFQKLIHDHLTEAFSRSYFELRLDESIHRVLRNPEDEAWVVMLDIDNFKTINDRFGHAAGDLVLREVVLIIRRSLRETDLVARFGGDEFAVLMPDIHSPQHARDVVERLRSSICSHTFRWRGTSFAVTCSFGMTHLDHSTASLDKAAEELLITADEALYDSKRSGKNVVSMARVNPTVEVFKPRVAI